MSRDKEEVNYYHILGLNKGASLDEIKKAYHNLARTKHPDKGGDTQEFRKIKEAFDKLTNPEPEQSIPFGPQPNEVIFSDDLPSILAQIFHHAGFNAQFNGLGRGVPSDFRTTNKAAYTINVSLEDIYNGTNKNIKITDPIPCKDCKYIVCPTCSGTGYKADIRQMQGFIQRMQSTCASCKGQGKIYDITIQCKSCNNERRIKVSKTVGIEIKKGSLCKQKIRYDNAVIDVQVIQHKVFSRHDEHLSMKKTIALEDALFGYAFHVKHLDGKLVYIDIHDVINPKDVICIEGEGMPYENDPIARGNLYIEFDVMFPKNVKEAHEKFKFLKPIKCPMEQNARKGRIVEKINILEKLGQQEYL